MKLDPYRQEVERMLANGAENQSIADAFQVDEASVRRFRRKYGLVRGQVAAAPVTAEVSELELLQSQVKDLTAALTKTRAVSVKFARIEQAIHEALDRMELPQSKPPAPPTPPSTAKHRQAVLLSDWHAGEVVQAEAMGGLNAFDWDILVDRVGRVYSAMISFKRARPALTGLDVWFLGDMVSGNIHDELVATNQYPVAEQAVKVGGLMGQLITMLAGDYPSIHVCAVAGNHARTTPQHASKDVFDSWDWVAYQIAKVYTRNLTNVTWDLPHAGAIVREIAGQKVLLFHGDGIRSSMPGVPWGGVVRRTNELTKQYASAGVHLDGFALGHFHDPNVASGRIFMNGSLVGTNEYGIKNFGGGAPPTQLLLTYDERKERLTDVGYLTP